MHFDKIEDYSFSHGLHFNPNTGEYHSLNPHDLGRPLTHEEMDYNLVYQKQTLNGWRIVGGNDDFTLKQSDLGKILKFHEIANTDDDFSRYSSGGLFVNQRVWIPADLAVADPCASFQVINSGATNSLTYQPLLTTMATTESPLGTSATNATTQATQATFGTIATTPATSGTSATTQATTPPTTQATYTITWNAGVGVNGPDIVGQHPMTQTFTEGTMFNLPGPAWTVNGKQFLGWSTTPSLNGPVTHNPGDLWSVQGNQTFYGIYTNIAQTTLGSGSGGGSGATEATTLATTTTQQMGPAILQHNTQTYEEDSSGGSNSFYDYNAKDSNGAYVHDNQTIVASYENPLYGNMTGGTDTHIRSQQNGVDLQIGDVMEWWNPIANEWGLISDWGMGPDRRGVYEDTTGIFSNANENWIVTVQNGILTELIPFSQITNITVTYSANANPSDITGNFTTTETRTIGQTFSAPGPTFGHNGGWTFLAWSPFPNGGSPEYAPGDAITLQSSNDVTFYAQWLVPTAGTNATTVGTSATTELPITEATTQSFTTTSSGGGSGETTTSSGGGSGETTTSSGGGSGETNATTQSFTTTSSGGGSGEGFATTTSYGPVNTTLPISTSSGGGSGETTTSSGGGSGETNATTQGTNATSATTSSSGAGSGTTTSSGGGSGETNATSATTVGTNATSATTVGTNATSATTSSGGGSGETTTSSGGGSGETNATTVGTSATSATTVGTNATSATTVGTSATTTQVPTTIDSGGGSGETTTSSGGGSGETSATTLVISTSATSATTDVPFQPATTSSGGGSGLTDNQQ